MRQSIQAIWLSVLFCALLAACGPRQPQIDVAPATTPSAILPTGQAEANDEGYVHITPAQLASMLEDKDFLLINTHAPYGFEIERTDAHIPLDEEGEWLRHYPADKTAKIVLYCRSGKWSTIAARELVAAGYTNIYHLDGGMAAWHADGLPLQGN